MNDNILLVVSILCTVIITLFICILFKILYNTDCSKSSESLLFGVERDEDYIIWKEAE